MTLWDPKFKLMTADQLLRRQQEEAAVPSTFPRGGVSEVSGPAGGGKTEWVVQALASTSTSSEGRIAWLEETLTIYPCALEQAGIDLKRVYFVEAGHALLACVQQVTRSGLFEAVVVGRSSRDWEERIWRRLQLVAEGANAAMVILSEEATREGGWTLALQVEVQRNPKDGALRPQIRKGTNAWKIQSIG